MEFTQLFDSVVIPLVCGVLWLAALGIAALLGFTLAVGRWDWFCWVLLIVILLPGAFVPGMGDPHVVKWYIASVIGVFMIIESTLQIAMSVYRRWYY